MAVRGERYETLRVIASGGMATVHLGRALGAGGFERLVAIKVMHPHLASEPTFVAMFLDEARLAARIRHPNVVSTLDVQADDEGVFLVMEYVEGPSLQQIFRALLKANQQLPLDVLIRILVDTLAGLHAAHELCDATGQPLHLVHRDVSPQNILIGADGISRITDFGVASAEARLSSTQGGQIKGKIGYMSPEQARAEALDRRADIYAAGVILWEILAGGRRFRSGTEATILTAVAEGDHVRPSVHNSAVPPALEECCLRAVMREPADRFATAADFADALEKAAAASGIQVVSARQVASFVTELNAHARPIDLPAPVSLRSSLAGPLSVRQSQQDLRGEALDARQSSPRLGAPGPDARPAGEAASNARSSLSAITTGEPEAGATGPGAVDDASLLQTRPEGKGAGAEVSTSSMSAANLVRHASLRPERRSPRWLLWGGGAALLVALATVTFLSQSEGSGDGGPSRPTGHLAPTAGAASAPVPVAPPAPPPPDTSEARADPPPEPAGDAGAPVQPSPPTRAAVAPGDAQSTTRRPDATKKPPPGDDKPDSKSPVYRPPEL